MADELPEGRTDVPDNATSGCVGTQSDQAGKAASCEGCPNQSACASGATKAVDPAVMAIAEALSGIRHKVLVLSGKGGVGKSTFSSQMALALAARGYTVGILDIDLCGPSIPRMLGVDGREVHQSGSGWAPVWLNDRVAVMSIGFMLPDKDGAVVWRGPRKSGLIKQFLKDVDWGELDFLVFDTPPGTSDEHIALSQYLKESGVDGAVVVTTPQEVAMQDVRKELNFCRKVDLNVLGVVENMSGFVCPCCDTKSDIFPRPTGGGPRAMAEAFRVPFLGALPLDPRMSMCCEAGEAFVKVHPDAPAAKAFNAVVDGVIKATGADPPELDSEDDDVGSSGAGSAVDPAAPPASSTAAGTSAGTAAAVSAALESPATATATAAPISAEPPAPPRAAT